MFGSLFTREHRHKWQTSHTNKWMHPTRQWCKCGAARHVETNPERMVIPGVPGEWPRLEYRWVHSDGVTGPWRKLNDPDPV
jgi:hypothetical protein